MIDVAEHIAVMDSFKKLTWKRIQRRRDSFENKYMAIFRRILNKQYSILADSIDVTNYRDLELPDKKIDSEPIEWGMIELYKGVGATFAQESFNGLKSGMPGILRKEEELIDTWYQQMISHVKTAAGAKIVSITEESRRQAIKIIKQVLEEGVDLGANETATLIKKALIKNGTIINQWRSLRIARTEIVAASNFGSMQGALATGLPMVKEWLPTYDSRTRDTHMAVAAQNPKEMNEMFQVGAYLMQYPGSPEGGAEEVINCRCGIVHRVKEINIL